MLFAGAVRFVSAGLSGTVDFVGEWGNRRWRSGFVSNGVGGEWGVVAVDCSDVGGMSIALRAGDEVLFAGEEFSGDGGSIAVREKGGGGVCGVL